MNKTRCDKCVFWREEQKRCVYYDTVGGKKIPLDMRCNGYKRRKSRKVKNFILGLYEKEA